MKQFIKMGQFEVINDQPYGKYHDYYWHMYESSQEGIYRVVFGFQGDDAFASMINNSLKEEYKVFVRDSFATKGQVAICDINVRFEPERVNVILQTICELAREHQCSPASELSETAQNLGLFLSGKDLIIRNDGSTLEAATKAQYRRKENSTLAYAVSLLGIIGVLTIYYFVGDMFGFIMSGVAGYAAMMVGLKAFERYMVRPTQRQIKFIIVMTFVGLFMVQVFLRSPFEWLNANDSGLLFDYILKFIVSDLNFWFEIAISFVFAYMYVGPMMSSLRVGATAQKQKSYKRGNHRIL